MKPLSDYDIWQWEQWSTHEGDCSGGFRRRQRTCYPNQECVGGSLEVDINNFDETGKNLAEQRKIQCLSDLTNRLGPSQLFVKYRKSQNPKFF